jgi:hypothetical protein
VVQAVTDLLGDLRLGGDARKLVLEPALERYYQGLAPFLARPAPIIGVHSPDCLLDGIERSNPFKRFARDRPIATFGDIVEPPAQVRPTEGERDHLAGGGGNLLVGGIAVALHDAAIAFEQFEPVDRAAPRRVAEGDCRRIGPAPGAVVASDRPEIALLGAATAGIEHRRNRLIDGDLGGGEDELAQATVDGLELGARIAGPERQHRPLDVEALGGQHLGLAVERQMPGVFGNQHGGHHRFRRQPALDQPLGRSCLHDRLLTGPAGIFGTVRHQHPELRRDHVEPLGGLLADHVQGRPAAGAIGVVRLDRHMHARQMSGKRATVGATLLGTGASPFRVPLVVVGFGRGDGLLDVLKRQMQLVRIELLRAAAKLGALQLVQQMLQSVILRLQVIALCNRGVSLRTRLREQRLQRCDVGWRLISALALAHATTESDSRAVVTHNPRPDSISHSLTTSPLAGQRPTHGAAPSPNRRPMRRAARQTAA